MKKFTPLLTCLICCAFSFVTKGQNFNHGWIQSLPGTELEYVQDIKYDNNGHIYVTGYFEETIEFDSLTPGNSYTADGRSDFFLLKLDTTGNLKWSKVIGGSGSDRGMGIFIENPESIYVTGCMSDTFNINTINGVQTLSTKGDRDILNLQLNSNGDILWAQTLGGIRPDCGYQIAVDKNGNIYTTGVFRYQIDIDHTEGELIFDGKYRDVEGVHTIRDYWGDIYLAKQDANHNFLWADQVSAEFKDYPVGLKIDSNGFVYHTGVFDGRANVGTIENPTIRESYEGDLKRSRFYSPQNDGFVRKFDPDGNLLWVKVYEEMLGTDFDSDNNTYFSYTQTDDQGYISYWSAKLDSNGNAIINKELNFDLSAPSIQKTFIDNYNQIYLTITASDYNTPEAGRCFIYKYDTDINYKSRYYTGGSGFIQNMPYIEFDDQNNIYATGTFNGEISSFGSASLNSLGDPSDFLQQDIFIQKIGQIPPSISILDTTVCDSSFTWMNGVTYYSNNNTASVSLVGSRGNDSIITLNLTLLPKSYHTDTIVSCEPIRWIDGVVYSENNDTAQFVLQNQFGCDSIITLNFTINSTEPQVDSIVACGAYTWIDGITYSESNNTAEYILQNQHGCDSLIRLELTILPQSFGIDQITTCDSYTWINGVTYTESNSSDTHTLTNYLGCDSIVQLNLTINDSHEATERISACDSYTWKNNITYTSSTEEASILNTNIYGCDSIINLDLTINYSESHNDVISSCDSYTWINGTTYHASNNSDFVILTNSDGCDSTVYLDLSISESISTTEEIESCDSYTWTDGITYDQSNNTASKTLTSISGCDSIVLLDLTIHESFIGVQSEEVCDSLTWINGVTYYTSTNQPTWIGTSIHGCDSLISLDLTINDSPNLEIDVETETATIIGTEGLSNYTWIDCETEQIVSEMASNLFKPETNSSYALEASLNGCTSRTPCLSINTVGFEISNNTQLLSVYPNPFDDQLHINLIYNQETAIVRIFSSNGQIIYNNESFSGDLIEIDQELPKGAYYLQVITGNRSESSVIIKE